MRLSGAQAVVLELLAILEPGHPRAWHDYAVIRGQLYRKLPTRVMGKAVAGLVLVGALESQRVPRHPGQRGRAYRITLEGLAALRAERVDSFAAPLEDGAFTQPIP